MKLLVLILSITLFTVSYASEKKQCSQKVYDNIYRAILMKAIDSKLTQEDMIDRNRSIVVLRELCYGQLSSWEKGIWK